MVLVMFFIRILNYNPGMKRNMASSDYHKSLVTGKLLEQRPRKKHLQNSQQYSLTKMAWFNLK